MKSLGLQELKEKTLPGECPFCGEKCKERSADPEARRKRLKFGTTEYQLTCGDEVCKLAYHRFYGRDRDRPLLSREEKDRNNLKKRLAYAALKAKR